MASCSLLHRGQRPLVTRRVQLGCDALPRQGRTETTGDAPDTNAETVVRDLLAFRLKPIGQRGQGVRAAHDDAGDTPPKVAH